MPRRAESGERLPLGRLEQHVEAACSLQERLEIGRDQGAGRIGLAADRPVGAQLQQQPLAMQRRPGIVGLLDLDELAVAAQEELGGPEGRRADDEIALEAGREVAEGGDAHVVGWPSKTTAASASGVPRFHSLTIRG